jgi:hypothetical protein
MFYLVGVDHPIQHTEHMTQKKRKSVREFRGHIREKVTSLGIGTIAEEFSESLLQRMAVQSTVLPLATELGVSHRYCDPDREERKKLGIDDFPKREKVWLERIADLKDSNVLFICGNKHVQSFSALLRSSGFKCEVISDSWGTELPM